MAKHARKLSSLASHMLSRVTGGKMGGSYPIYHYYS